MSTDDLTLFMNTDHQSICEESGEGTREEHKVHLWDAIGTIASTISDQSKKALETYSREIFDFASSIRDEAVEAYHIQEEALRPQIDSVKSEVASLPNKLASEAAFVVNTLNEKLGLNQEEPKPKSRVVLDEDFILTDHSTLQAWTAFIASSQPPLQSIHKATILRNDIKLSDLYHEIVPKIVSDEKFWDAWLFSKYIEKHGYEIEVTQPQTPSTDWDSWDNDELNTAVLKTEDKVEQCSKTSKDNLSEGWSDWD